MNAKNLLLAAVGILIFCGGPRGAAAEEVMRGTLVFKKDATEMSSMAHWDEYPWKFEAIRWGRYHVEVSYHGLKRAMGVQARMRSNGDDRAKGFLKGGGTPDKPVTARLGGTVYVPEHGEQEIVLFTPPDDPIYDFKVTEVRLVPAPEGEEIAQEGSEAIELLAKDATTYAEKMRYEPKEEKNCLGFWIFVEDYAEWDFEVATAGEYEVRVFQGCGKGQGGSKVGIEVGGKSLEFQVRDTGDFQNWKEYGAGTVALEAGSNTLAVRPAELKAKAVMDIQKIVLKPKK